MLSTIKVLIVDDSALIRQMLTRALTLDPRIEIVGSARTGVEAIEKATEAQPDVITLDIEMPELTGIEALPHLLKATPARVVMLSSVDDPDTTYQALSLGAVDFIAKPKGGFATSLSDLSELLIKKIKTAYRVPPDRRLTVAEDHAAARPAGGAHAPGVVPALHARPKRAVAFAASTGGPPALEAVFSGLTASLPSTYLIVQHLPAGFTASLARRLSKVTDIRVVEAAQGMPLETGVAYIAPHGSHMTVEGDTAISSRIHLEEGPSIHGVKPAADPLLESVARRFGDQAIGVVLTGMGSDGAVGLKLIREHGGATIAQDEETSVVWGMPKAATTIGAADRVVPLSKVATEVRRSLRGEA